MSFVTSFGVLPHSRPPRSNIQSAVLPWSLDISEIEGVQPQRKKRRASAPVAEKATPKTKPAEAIEQQPVRFFDLLLATLESQHQPDLEKQLGKLPKLASERGIKLFCLSKNDSVIDALIQVFRGAADSHRGSFALVGLRVRNPIVVIVEEEIKAIAAQLQLKPWAVLQAMTCHELAHCVGWTACDLLNDPYFLSEQVGWDWGRNIREKYCTISEQSFDRVAQYCLESHGIDTGDYQ